jgi:hypothetical protein
MIPVLDRRFGFGLVYGVLIPCYLNELIILEQMMFRNQYSHDIAEILLKVSLNTINQTVSKASALLQTTGGKDELNMQKS